MKISISALALLALTVIGFGCASNKPASREDAAPAKIEVTTITESHGKLRGTRIENIDGYEINPDNEFQLLAPGKHAISVAIQETSSEQRQNLDFKGFAEVNQDGHVKLVNDSSFRLPFRLKGEWTCEAGKSYYIDASKSILPPVGTWETNHLDITLEIKQK